ncbi:hypothetical protein Ccrd_011860 [Cynara cardunculus var. scolymus]|uniref:Uncharacterized protein n=1 Tax=Cynara cardunculus var. scolymus TaxID=59895 RepID=A0A103YIH8_CYNCS|nr:hypothetical protein Ccrd_011860 [Cynara cardunculus var. scolymus]
MRFQYFTYLHCRGADLYVEKMRYAAVKCMTRSYRPTLPASLASLFMPEPDDAVAHGDASLAVNDFLTRGDDG